MSEDSVLELLAMFPNIPPQEVRLQATRSQSMQAAIDRLLVLSERFPPSVSISRESITSPARSSIPVSIPSMPVHVETVSTEEWLRDANIRQRLQQQRKQYLAQQAFKSVLS